jgi:pSer/pThr/pTyr-binding forkhead associated (FHA) protein
VTQRPNKPPDLNLDLESTAELPVKDIAAIADDLHADRTVQVRAFTLDDSLSATDVYPVQIPPDLQALTSNLQHVDERIRRKSERVDELQAELVASRETAASELAALRESAALELAAARETAARDVAAAEAAVDRANALADERAARIRQLEQDRDALAADVARRRAVLEAEMAQLREGVESDVAQRRAALDAELEQQRQALEQARARNQVKLGELELEAQGLRRQVLRQQELLATAQAGHGVVHSMLDDRDREVDAARANASSAAAQAAQAAQSLVQRDARIAELEAQLVALRKELADSRQHAVELEARVADLSAAVAAADGGDDSRADALRVLEQRLAAQVDAASELEERLRVAEAAAEEAVRLRGLVEEDLRAAEEQLHRVESDLRQREARLGDLQGMAEPLRERVQKLEQWLRDRDEEVERLASEAAARAAVLGNLQQSMQRLGSEQSGKVPVLPSPADAIRMLVRLDGPAEVVTVLGRRTTIGRTPDNALQVDAGYVSRHHAVVLVSENHTVIEDLNSTNGVLVNGRRVTRSLLRDGDTVTIGKADFRYDLRGTAILKVES